MNWSEEKPSHNEYFLYSKKIKIKQFSNIMKKSIQNRSSRSGTYYQLKNVRSHGINIIHRCYCCERAHTHLPSRNQNSGNQKSQHLFLPNWFDCIYLLTRYRSQFPILLWNIKKKHYSMFFMENKWARSSEQTNTWIELNWFSKNKKNVDTEL